MPLLSDKEIRKNAILDEELRKLKFANDKNDGLYVLKSRGGAIIEQVLSAIDVVLEQKLENEWPSVVAGLETAQARIYGRRLRDSIRGELHKLGALWRGL